MLKGGCFCGNVRYETDGTPFNASLCHCIDCRRVASSPLAAWFSVKREALHYVAAQPKEFASSDKVLRTFCPDCGSPLTYWNADAADDIDVATCSLDDPAAVPPADHVWASRKLQWLHTEDGLPHYPEERPD